MRSSRHSFTGDWALPSVFGQGEWAVDVHPTITNLIRLRRLTPTDVEISDLGYKPTTGIHGETARLVRASTRHPIVVLKDCYNPQNKKYRVIDGRHRIVKTLLSGETVIPAYILTIGDIMPYVYRI